ncbi:MAG: DUF6503 family protein [Bacteroidota bacterium]
MKHLILFLILLVFTLSCKEKSNTTEAVTSDTTEVQKENPYPEALEQVFEAHGGIELWRKQKTLTYVIPKPGNPETHITDLFSRKDKIETPNYDMGFDGNTPWLLNKGKEYQGNVEFYHNLMFYFYAMPFVLGDDGIQYNDATALHFEGKTYPGIKISYHDGIGTSPKDEYYLHYNPETYEMEWLGYTVTYRTGEDSDNVKWIRYDDWGTFNGLKLPNAISWYNYEGLDIKDLRSTVKFEQVAVSTELKPTGFYDKPTDGTYFVKTE